MQLDNIVIISGPSGAGEDSVIEGLCAITEVHRVITTTTRPPREGESEGYPYHFISESEFREKIEKGEMVEWAQQYNGHLYGVPMSELGRINALPGTGIWKLDYKGVQLAQEKFPEITTIMLTADSMEVLEQRLRSRDASVTEEFIQERMAYTREWLAHADIYDYVVINHQGKLDETINEVVDILKKEQYL